MRANFALQCSSHACAQVSVVNRFGVGGRHLSSSAPQRPSAHAAQPGKQTTRQHGGKRQQYSTVANEQQPVAGDASQRIGQEREAVVAEDPLLCGEKRPQLPGRVRGTNDRFDVQSQQERYVVEKARAVASCFGCETVRTPVIEFADLFERAVGSDSELVQRKEMYNWEDLGGNRVCLRPEGTAPVARALLQQVGASQLCATPRRMFYSGPMFRYERPQAGRSREFTQLGIEFVGEAHPGSDVEAISCASKLLQHILPQTALVELNINSLGTIEDRELYLSKALIPFLAKFKTELSVASQTRIENRAYFRVLDSSDPVDQDLLLSAPSILDYLSEASRIRFDVVTSTLESLGIKFRVTPTLVRGLDYYSHTVFEFIAKNTGGVLGRQQSTVIAGGRYDGLFEKLGAGQVVPACGWAAGIERLCLISDQADLPPLDPLIVVATAPATTDTIKCTLNEQAFLLVDRLRGMGLRTLQWPEAKISKQFRRADRAAAAAVVVVGEREAAENKAVLKIMASGKQREIPLDDIPEHVQLLLSTIPEPVQLLSNAEPNKR